MDPRPGPRREVRAHPVLQVPLCERRVAAIEEDPEVPRHLPCPLVAVGGIGTQGAHSNRFDLRRDEPIELRRGLDIALANELERCELVVGVEKTPSGEELPEDRAESEDVGAMIEVPSLLWQLDDLFASADFVAVGSNDLQQFLYAADRGNQRVSDRFDPISMPMLRVLKDIVERANAHGVPATLCGEIAGTTIGAMMLIGLGYRSLSVAPANIGPVKTMILSLDAGQAKQFFDNLLASGTSDVRSAIVEFAERGGVNLAGDPSRFPDDTDDDDLLRAAGA